MRNIKKLFAGILVVSLLVFSIPVFAVEEELVPYEYYYWQLSTDEKMLYRELIALYNDSFAITQIAEFEEFDYVFIYDKANFAGEEDYASAVYEIKEIQAVQEEIFSALDSAHTALQLDHPELFGKRCRSYFWYDFDLEKEKTVDVFLNFVIELTPLEGYGAYAEEYLQVLDKVRQIGASGTRWEKLKAIHNYLIVNTVYEEKYEENESRCVFVPGAYLDGKSVCQGYAMAFKVACDYYGIPCVCVGGYGVQGQERETHMWNYVQMSDQQWYAVDVTWDDADRPAVFFYDYFLTGSSVRDENLGGDSFGETHKEDSNIFEIERQLVYPPLAADAYVPGENEPIDTGLAPWITPSPQPTDSPTLPPIPTPTAVSVSASPAPPEPKARISELSENQYTIVFFMAGAAVFAMTAAVIYTVKNKRNK